MTLGDREADPTRQVGIYVDPADWNDLIAAPDTLLIDTRNAFEVAMGTFEGAVDPGIKSFGQFKDFAARHLDPGEASQNRDVLHRRHPLRKGLQLSAVARLCRGLSPQGRHSEISGRHPEAQSRWRGECFVFDERVALGHGLRERGRGP